jgi:hypothetical protein
MISVARLTSARAIQSRSRGDKHSKRSAFIGPYLPGSFRLAFHDARLFLFHEPERRLGLMASFILLDKLSETSPPELRRPFISMLFNQFA